MQIHIETIDSGRPPESAKLFGAVTRGVPYTTSGDLIVLSRKEVVMSQPGFYFYTGDWLKDTRVLTPLMRGCWIDALCFLNENKGSVTWPITSFANFWGITNELAIEVLDAIAIAKVGNVSWQTDSKTIAKLSNRRMLKETANRVKIKEKRTKAGKKGAAIRWQKWHSSSSISSSESSSLNLKEEDNTSHLGSNGASASTPSLNDKLTAEGLIVLYNETVNDNFSAVEKISEGRLKKARQYLKQFPQRDFWLEVFKELNRSSFLAGKSNSAGHESFRASFDWLLSKGKDGTENAVKVYEGKYRE